MSIMLRVLFFIPYTDFLKNCAPKYGAQSGIYQCCRSWLWVNWNCVNIKRQSQSLVDCCRRMNEFSNVFAMMKYKPKGQTGSSGGQNVGDNEKIKQPALSHVQALGVGPSHKSCLSQHIATLFTQVSDKLAEKLLPSKHTNTNYAFWYLLLIKFFWENAIVNLLQNIFGLSNAFTHKMIKDVHKH